MAAPIIDIVYIARSIVVVVPVTLASRILSIANVPPQLGPTLPALDSRYSSPSNDNSAPPTCLVNHSSLFPHSKLLAYVK